MNPEFGIQEEHQVRRRLAGPNALERLDQAITAVDNLSRMFDALGIHHGSLEAQALEKVRETLFWLGAETKCPYARIIDTSYDLTRALGLDK